MSYNPAFSKVLYVVPPDTGDVVNQDTLAGGSVTANVTEGAGGVLTVDSLTGGAATGTRDPGTYVVEPTSDGSGTGIVLQVVVDDSPNAGRVQLTGITILNGGKGSAVDDTLTIDGADLTTDNDALATDVTVDVATISTAANATGVSSDKRPFIPVNAGLTRTALTNATDDSDDPHSPRRGDGIDYGDEAENLAEQRLQCWKTTGPNADQNGAERQNESHAATNGPDGTSKINVTVFGNVRT